MLKIKDLRKSYGTFELNCSMEIPAGCITGLVGSNGAGKSTTFKSVLGLISTDGGSIEVFGKEIHAWTKAEKQRMGVVLANAGFNTYLTMKDMETVLSRMYPRFDRAMFREYCSRYQLPADKRIKEFSTGMLAKAKILAAITHKADLLLLDEPTTGLDVLAREELLDMLRAYMEEDEERTILISSHISTDLEGLCDDLYMIDNGEIVLHEEMDVLLGQYGILKVTQSQFDAMEKQYLLRVMKESYGYRCLTGEKQFYLENYPNLTLEKGNVDEVIAMMVKGEAI
ncbi:MAG TPA: ABC transporter ATP-binding protein [Candidatus Blautia stercoravium]|nr:ABC transporter ATP-binding protein [Candidatus Blautia stercoravium]